MTVVVMQHDSGGMMHLCLTPPPRHTVLVSSPRPARRASLIFLSSQSGWCSAFSAQSYFGRKKKPALVLRARRALNGSPARSNRIGAAPRPITLLGAAEATRDRVT